MISENSTIKEIKNDSILAKITPYLIYNTAMDGTENISDDSITLRDIQKKTPTWSATDMAYGLNRIIENGKQGNQLLFQVYNLQEITLYPEKQHVKLIYFPPSGSAEKQKNVCESS